MSLEPTPAYLRHTADKFRQQIGGVYCYVAAALDHQADQREALAATNTTTEGA